MFPSNFEYFTLTHNVMVLSTILLNVVMLNVVVLTTVVPQYYHD